MKLFKTWLSASSIVAMGLTPIFVSACSISPKQVEEKITDPDFIKQSLTSEFGTTFNYYSKVNSLYGFQYSQDITIENPTLSYDISNTSNQFLKHFAPDTWIPYASAFQLGFVSPLEVSLSLTRTQKADYSFIFHFENTKTETLSYIDTDVAGNRSFGFSTQAQDQLTVESGEDYVVDFDTTLNFKTTIDDLIQTQYSLSDLVDIQYTMDETGNPIFSTQIDYYRIFLASMNDDSFGWNISCLTGLSTEPHVEKNQEMHLIKTYN